MKSTHSNVLGASLELFHRNLVVVDEAHTLGCLVAERNHVLNFVVVGCCCWLLLLLLLVVVVVHSAQPTRWMVVVVTLYCDETTTTTNEREPNIIHLFNERGGANGPLRLQFLRSTTRRGRSARLPCPSLHQRSTCSVCC